MCETPSSTAEFGWFKSNYGIDFESLDRKMQAIVRQLGRNGVEALVQQNQNTRSYRGSRISHEEEIYLAESIARLVDTSTDLRFIGPGSRSVNNNPYPWVDEEYNELGNPDRD